MAFYLVVTFEVMLQVNMSEYLCIHTSSVEGNSLSFTEVKKIQVKHMKLPYARTISLSSLIQYTLTSSSSSQSDPKKGSSPIHVTQSIKE